MAKELSDRDQRNTKGKTPVINYFVEPIKESTEVYLTVGKKKKWV